MMCPWNAFLSILPQRLRQTVDRKGKEILQELRMRSALPIQMVTSGGDLWLSETATDEDIQYIVNVASRYSPWASSTAAYGYITAPGGHRIGLSGECVWEGDRLKGLRKVTGLCIRVARDFSGISRGIPLDRGSILLLGPPGWGKTTLLRDLVRRISDHEPGCIAVVDERGEIFPPAAGFTTGRKTDILTGCTKAAGIDMALRTLGPTWIAVDEITSSDDCNAMIHAGWCGARLIATAHARDAQDLLRRPVYRPLVETGLFETRITLQRDKSWRLERNLL